MSPGGPHHVRLMSTGAVLSSASYGASRKRLALSLQGGIAGTGVEVGMEAESRVKRVKGAFEQVEMWRQLSAVSRRCCDAAVACATLVLPERHSAARSSPRTCRLLTRYRPATGQPRGRHSIAAGRRPRARLWSTCARGCGFGPRLRSSSRRACWAANL